MKDKRPIVFGVGIGIGIAVVALAVFGAGYVTGAGRAGAFPLWGRHSGLPRPFVPTRFGHGIVGTIDSIGNDTFIVKERDGGMKTVLVDSQTLIRRDTGAIAFSDLRTGEQVIVLGNPQEKEAAVKAKLVRVIGEFQKEATRSGIPPTQEMWHKWL